MTVAELITKLEKFEAPEAEVSLITSDYQTVRSTPHSVKLYVSRKGVKSVELSDDERTIDKPDDTDEGEE